MQNPKSKAELQQNRLRLANSYSELLAEFSSKDLTHVGNYTVGKLIGKGSFGKVYLARHNLSNGAKVVLKASGKDDPNLAREIHHHRQFIHPHIARLYEVVITENHVHLVLEYCPGDELYNYICNKGPLPVETAQKIFTQLVGAVAYIHSKSCVHRDLKLENVLLDKNENVKLCDFGFTREYEGKSNYLQTFCGTVCYSAPEMLRGEKYAGEKVDVWSLGIILYALLKGELPFDDDDDTATKAKILKDDPKYPETWPEGATTLISKLLSKRPIHRPSLADVLADPFLIDFAPRQQEILKLTQPAPFTTHLEKQTLERMKAAGVDIDKVIESVLSQRCDALAGWWTLLYEKESRKEARRERKRKEREAELKLLRRLSGASGRFSTVQPTLAEVDEETRHESRTNGQIRTRSNSRGRAQRRLTPQILVSDLPQLPEGSPVHSPGTMTPPPPLDKDSSRSRSNSRNARPPLPPKERSREWKRRSSNLQLVTTNEHLGPANGVTKRSALTRVGRLKRNNQFLNQLSVFKHWIVDSTKRARSPAGKASSLSSQSQTGKSPQASLKTKSQPHLSLHAPLSAGRPEQDRSLSGTSTTATRNSSYGNNLTPQPGSQTNGVHATPKPKIDTARVRSTSGHHASNSVGSSTYHRNSMSPSPLTPRGSTYGRLSSASGGLRGRKSTSSSVSSVRSMARHTASHSKASSRSSNSLDTIHSPAGSRSGSLTIGRSSHNSIKVLPAPPLAGSFSSNGRLVRTTGASDDGSYAGGAPLSKFNEAAIFGAGSNGVLFAKRKKTPFKGPTLNSRLFGESGGMGLGSPAFPRHREGSDGKLNLGLKDLGGIRKRGSTSSGSNTLTVDDHPVSMGKRKSQIIEEEEEDEEADTRNGIMEEDEEEDEEEIEEVDEFDDLTTGPWIKRGESLHSVVFLDESTGAGSNNKGGSFVFMASPPPMGPPQTPRAMETPKESLDLGPRSPGAASGIGVGESATTPRMDLGSEWGKS